MGLVLLFLGERSEMGVRGPGCRVVRVLMVDECFRYLPPHDGIRTRELALAWGMEGECAMSSVKRRSGEVSNSTGTASATSTTLQITLSEEEYAELRRAVTDAKLPNSSLLVFQAIHAGLESGEAHFSDRKRTRSVSIHVSREFKQRIRARAQLSQLTQQSLLRGLLLHYIRNKRWQTTQTHTAEEEGAGA